MMGALLQRHPVTSALVAVLLALLLVIGYETGWGSRWGAALPALAMKPATAVEAKLLPALVATPAEVAYPETAERPIFAPLRRPAPPGAGPSSMVKGQFVLQGVTMHGNLRIALLREKSNGRVHRAEKGREVNGISIAEIEPERVTLRQGDDQEVLTLGVQKALPGAAAAQAGPFGGAAPAPGIAPAQGIAPAAPAFGPVPAASGPSPSAVPGMAPAVPRPQPATPIPPPAGVTPSTSSGQAPESGTAAAPAPMTPEELLARRRARRTQQ